MVNLADHYETLGCTKNSTQKDIKRAYHALALRYHPDKSAATIGSLQFHRITEAWKVLGDPREREQYDLACKQAELDSESILIYARISPDQLLPNINDDILEYHCRCGGVYQIQRECLQEKNISVHVPCQECTFLIIVDT